ncbi:MAG: methylamine utilization protein [Pseudomonadales bacterium]|nr:methylamine utilization protein [Pseudomonadales bacterium]
MQIRILILSLLMLSACFTQAAEFTVGQTNKAFTPTTLTIKKGDTVKFINNDAFFHNVFSLSDVKFFDLGSFPKGEFKIVTFEDAGVVDVECAIHPEMKMIITVK